MYKYLKYKNKYLQLQSGGHKKKDPIEEDHIKKICSQLEKIDFNNNLGNFVQSLPKLDLTLDLDKACLKNKDELISKLIYFIIYPNQILFDNDQFTLLITILKSTFSYNITYNEYNDKIINILKPLLSYKIDEQKELDIIFLELQELISKILKDLIEIYMNTISTQSKVPLHKRDNNYTPNKYTLRKTFLNLPPKIIKQ